MKREGGRVVHNRKAVTMKYVATVAKVLSPSRCESKRAPLASLWNNDDICHTFYNAAPTHQHGNKAYHL